MGDYWRTSGRSRLKVRARNGMGARAERRAAVARADFLYEAPPAGGTTKNHPKRPRRASEVGSNGYDPVAARGVIASAVSRNNDRPSSGHLYAAPIITSGGRILRRHEATTTNQSSFSRSHLTPNMVPYGHIDSSLHQQQSNNSFASRRFEWENPTYAESMHSPEYSHRSQHKSHLYHDRSMCERERREQDREQRYHQENSFEMKWGAQPSTSVASVLARRQSSAGLDWFRSGKRPAAEISLSPPPRHPPISTVTLPSDNWRHVAVDSLSDVGSPGGREERWRDNDSFYNPAIMVHDFGSMHDSSFGLTDNPSGVRHPSAHDLLQDRGQFLYPGQSTMTQYSNKLSSKRGPLQGFDRFRWQKQSSLPPIDFSQHSQQLSQRVPVPGIDRFRYPHTDPPELPTTINTPDLFAFQQNAQAPQQRRVPIPGISRFRRDQEAPDELAIAPNQFSLESPIPENGAFPLPDPPEVLHPPIRNDFFRPDLRNCIPRFQPPAEDYLGMVEGSLKISDLSPRLDTVDNVTPVQEFSGTTSDLFRNDGNAQSRELLDPSLGSRTGSGIPQFQATSEAAPEGKPGGCGIAKFQTRSSLALHESPTEHKVEAGALIGTSSYPQAKPSGDTTSFVARPKPVDQTTPLEESKSTATVGIPKQATAPLRFQTYRAPSPSKTLPQQPTSVRPPGDKREEESTETPSPQTQEWKRAPKSTSLLLQLPAPRSQKPQETPAREQMLPSEKSENFFSPPTHRSSPLNQNISEIKFFLGEQEVDQRGTPFGLKETRKQDQEMLLLDAHVDSRDDVTQSSKEKSENETTRILRERRNESIWRHPINSFQDWEIRQETPKKKSEPISYHAWKESSNSGDDSDDDSWEEIEKELNKRKSLFRG